MENTTEDIKIGTDNEKRIPCCYEEPNPECRFEITYGDIEEFNELSNEQRERITWVRIEFVSDIHSCIKELKRFPNLRSVMFFCCYGSDEAGIDTYRGLAELSNLDTLIFHDSGVIDAETMKEIAALPKLRWLQINRQSLADRAALSALKNCGALEYLNLSAIRFGTIRDEVSAEDLAFVSCLKNLKCLESDMCKRVDVSYIHLPQSVETVTC